uniref:Uncharacterized protein n=1 Tax=Oryza glumipatula TaxID=40148 RepID=A0A0D9YFP2_9ORYZ
MEIQIQGQDNQHRNGQNGGKKPADQLIVTPIPVSLPYHGQLPPGSRIGRPSFPPSPTPRGRRIPAQSYTRVAVALVVVVAAASAASVRGRRKVADPKKKKTERKRVAASELVSQAASTWLNHRLAFRGRGARMQA